MLMHYVASGLAAAHEAGIVHRNIGPFHWNADDQSGAGMVALAVFIPAASSNILEQALGSPLFIDSSN